MEQFVQLGDLINPSIWAHLGMNDCGQSSQDQSREFSMTQQHKAALAQVTSYMQTWLFQDSPRADASTQPAADTCAQPISNRNRNEIKISSDKQCQNEPKAS